MLDDEILGNCAPRCNVLGFDRPDIQFTAKEALRWIASPCQGDYDKVVRIGKNLNGGGTGGTGELYKCSHLVMAAG